MKIIKKIVILVLFFSHATYLRAACTDLIEYLGNNDVYQWELGLRASGVSTMYGYDTDEKGVILPSCPIATPDSTKVKIPVLLIDWADYNPATDLSNPNNPDSGGNEDYVKASRQEISDFLNGSNGPAQYYKDVSGGQFQIEFEVIDWIVSDAVGSYLKNREEYYYKPNWSDNLYCDRDQIMVDAIKSAVTVKNIDFTVYDVDRNNHSNVNKIVDAPILMYEGAPGLCSGTNMSWLDGASLGKEDSVSGNNAIGLTRVAEMVESSDPNYSSFVNQNALINYYVNVPESSATGFFGIQDVGGLVHEIGHLILGFVDYYGNTPNVHGWSLSGAIGRNPSHPAAWEKWLFGRWISPTSITETKTIELNATDVADGTNLEGNYLIKIPLDSTENRYLTVEYRWLENEGNNSTIWSSNSWASGSLRESGLQIFEFDWSQSAFDINNVYRHRPEREGSYEHETFSFIPDEEFYKCYEDDFCILIDNIALDDAVASFKTTLMIDSDGDRCSNEVDLFPNDPNECYDNDSDGVGDNADLDDDNDGVEDSQDAFPLDPLESSDFDQDGTGDNADLDDDNDGVEDSIDVFPLDPLEASDFDQDGIGDNADLDDDNDGMSDEWENTYGLNPNDSSDAQGDLDGDGLTNLSEYQSGTDPTVAAPTNTPPVETESSGGGGSLGTNLVFLLMLPILLGRRRKN